MHDFQCPGCDRILTRLKALSVPVYACHGGCGGFWLSAEALDFFKRPFEPVGDELLRIRKDPEVYVNPGRKRICPQCRFYSMEKYEFSPLTRMPLDACTRCGGIWIDGGELQTIREIAAERADQTTFLEQRPEVDPDWDAHHPRPKPKYEVSTEEELHKIFYGDPTKRKGVMEAIRNFLNAEFW